MILSDVLRQYQIEFKGVVGLNDRPSFLSPITHLTSLFNKNFKLENAGALYREIYQVSNQSEDRISLLFSNTTNEVEIHPFLLSDREMSSSELFTLPKSELLTISLGWSQFVANIYSRKVEVTNGQGIIKILSDNFSNALSILRPVAVNWPDCGGSVAEYYTVSNYPDGQQKDLTSSLDNILISGTAPEILDGVSSFLSLFANGNYSISIGGLYLSDYDVCHDKQSEYSPSVKAVDRFTCWFYSPDRSKILFSRSYDSLDQKRIDHYADLIEKDIKPKVVLYTHYLHHDHFNCPYYIIDGHHKLMAYIKLKQNPQVVFISKDDYSGLDEVDIIAAAQVVLKPNEFEHYLINSSSENVSAYMHPGVTKALDNYILNVLKPSTEITELFYRAYHSSREEQREWVIDRLAVLRRNKHKGNGLSLYYIDRDLEKTYGSWKPLIVNNQIDFELWESIYLEDGPMPKYLKPPVMYQEKRIIKTPIKEFQYYQEGLTIREILIIVAVILGLLVWLLRL